MKEKPKSPRALPPRNAPFSFNVKMLLLEMTIATTDVKDCLKALAKEKPSPHVQQIAQQDLTNKAEKFHSITCLHLPALCWMAAARELTEAEVIAVQTLQERVVDLADSLSQAPLKHQQENLEEEFTLIREVGHILEVIEPSMQQEREDAAAKADLEKEEAAEEKHQQWVQGIIGHVISATVVGLLLLLAGILVKELFLGPTDLPRQVAERENC